MHKKNKLKTPQKNNRFKTFLKNNRYHMIAFLIPVAIMVFIYYIRGVYPFGDQIYLRSDCYHQYAPFHMELLNKLQNGESLLYSWDIGMGVNFISVIAYYLASPFNIILLFFPAEYMTELIGIYLIFKIGLCGAACSWYLGKHFHVASPLTAAFALFYALSSYIAAYNWNIMWLDCLWLFPLIIYGLERLVNKNKGVFYCITLGLAITSNYYIGIMLCIFSALYYLLLTIIQNNLTFKAFLLKSIRFSFYSLLAGGMAAFLILPEYCTLLLTVSSDMNFPDTLVRYFSVTDMLSRSLINVEPLMFAAYEPNVYCTVAAFLLVPLYVMCKSIPAKERAVKVCLTVFLLLSFNLNIPNYIWHGLHFPNSLPARESFIYIFLIVTMSFEAIHHIKEFSSREITCCFFAVMALFLVIEHLFVSDSYNFTIVYFSAAFVLLYFIICTYLRNPRYLSSLLCRLLLLIAACEMLINMEATSLVSTTSRDYYLADNKDIDIMTALAEKESDTLFYRTEKDYHRTKNDAAWIGYHSVSIFSSTANNGVSSLLAEWGLEDAYNAYSYYGHTPMTESLLSVKYVLSESELEETELRKLYSTSGNYYIYENLYTLPLGFMIPEDLLGDWMNKYTDNPFLVQNDFAGLATGCYNLFDSLISENYGDYIKVYADDEKDTDTYVYVINGCTSFSYTVYDKEEVFYTSGSFSDLGNNRICYIGTIPAGGYVRINNTDSDYSNIYLHASTFNEDVYLEVYDVLRNESMVVTEFTDTHIKGDITALSDGYLYTSIPYEEGWKVTVDGKEVPTSAFQNAFVTFPVATGTHTVEFSYYPKGLKTGIILSVSSILILILSIAAGSLLKKRKEKIEHQKKIDEITDLIEEELKSDVPQEPVIEENPESDQKADISSEN